MIGPTEGELSLDGAKDARAIKRLAGLHFLIRPVLHLHICLLLSFHRLSANE